MLIPLGDENDDYAVPYINYLLILSCIAVYFYDAFYPGHTAGSWIDQYGFVSAHYLPKINGLDFSHRIKMIGDAFVHMGGDGFFSIFVSGFFHGGLGHLFGNLFFLWMFGDNVEHVMGHVRYLVFYVLALFAAEFVQALCGGVSDVIGIGASGAICAVAGAYLFYYPKARIRMLFWTLPWQHMFTVPAYVFLILQFAMQLLQGVSQYGQNFVGVAFWAHIGGYLFGMAMSKPLKDPSFMFMEDANRIFVPRRLLKNKITFKLKR